MKNNVLTLGSLFDGIGGFPLAAVREGILPVWASEIETAPISITKRHFPDMQHLGDITKIKGDDIQPVDIITFGSPCQDLSISGHRAGLEGERSGLFMQAIRIIKEMRNATNGNNPARIIWENVPGAFSSDNGRDFQTVIEEIAKVAEPGISISQPSEKIGWLVAGAVVGDNFSLAWRVLDAQYWGVPQKRRRIFIVADFTNGSAGEILFKPESLSRDFGKSKTKGEGITADVETGFGAAGFTVDIGHSTDRIQVNPQSAVTLRANGGGGGAKNGLYFLPVQVPFRCRGYGDYADSETSRALLSSDDITTSDLITSDFSVRRLTPLECERVQGFPDGWTEFGHDGKRISDNQRYKALGNSVAIPCAQFLLSRMKK
jgi:DNA (cytosine-5)-methyltransferase 1